LTSDWRELADQREEVILDVFVERKEKGGLGSQASIEIPGRFLGEGYRDTVTLYG
jgi:hypothetical protein